MATLEERVAYLEGRLEDHASTVVDGRSGLSNLDVKVESVESRLAAKIDSVEGKFTWLAGIEITVLLALVGALLRG